MHGPSSSERGAAAGALATAARYIAVSVAGSLYGLSVDDVQEVIGMRPVTRLFHAPPAIRGVTNLRGEVLPVLDLAVLLGATTSDTEAHDPRIVVVRESSGARRRAGLSVDALRGLREVPESGLIAAPSTLGELAREIVGGVIATPPPCTVLNVSAILDSPLLSRFAGGESTG